METKQPSGRAPEDCCAFMMMLDASRRHRKAVSDRLVVPIKRAVRRAVRSKVYGSMQLSELNRTIQQQLDGSDECGRNRYRNTDLRRKCYFFSDPRHLGLQIVNRGCGGHF